MSRRITFFVLAASATLIATQASADRECFEDSCRQIEIAEPAASSLPPAAVDESAVPETSPVAAARSSAAEANAALEANAAAPKLTPAKALPQVVATPQVAPVKVVAAPAPRPPVQSFADHEPAKLAPRSLKSVAPAPAPVRVVDALPEDDARAAAVVPVAVLAAPANRPRRAVAVATAPVVAGHAISSRAISSPGAVYAEDDVVRVYPNPRHDPAWKVCQLDQRESDQRRCGAYSYHPYGANGYRPNGVYAAERGGSQVYLIAPSAKIIAVDDN